MVAYYEARKGRWQAGYYFGQVVEQESSPPQVLKRRGRDAEFVAVGALQASTIGLEVEAEAVDTDHSVGSGEVPAVYQRDWRRATRAGHRSARRRLGLRQRLKLRQRALTDAYLDYNFTHTVILVADGEVVRGR